MPKNYRNVITIEGGGRRPGQIVPPKPKSSAIYAALASQIHRTMGLDNPMDRVIPIPNQPIEPGMGHVETDKDIVPIPNYVPGTSKIQLALEDTQQKRKPLELDYEGRPVNLGLVEAGQVEPTQNNWSDLPVEKRSEIYGKPDTPIVSRAIPPTVTADRASRMDQAPPTPDEVTAQRFPAAEPARVDRASFMDQLPSNERTTSPVAGPRLGYAMGGKEPMLEKTGTSKAGIPWIAQGNVRTAKPEPKTSYTQGMQTSWGDTTRNFKTARMKALAKMYGMDFSDVEAQAFADIARNASGGSLQRETEFIVKALPFIKRTAEQGRPTAGPPPDPRRINELQRGITQANKNGDKATGDELRRQLEQELRKGNVTPTRPVSPGQSQGKNAPVALPQTPEAGAAVAEVMGDTSSVFNRNQYDPNKATEMLRNYQVFRQKYGADPTALSAAAKQIFSDLALADREWERGAMQEGIVPRTIKKLGGSPGIFERLQFGRPDIDPQQMQAMKQLQMMLKVDMGT